MKKTSTLVSSAQDHAAWVRSHTPIDDSPFPEYPDEKKRRGSSRGALPNGNPWHSELAPEKPGPRRVAPSASKGDRPARGVGSVEAPPKKPAPVASVRATASPTDRRIGDDVSRRLA